MRTSSFNNVSNFLSGQPISCCRMMQVFCNCNLKANSTSGRFYSGQRHAKFSGKQRRRARAQRPQSRFRAARQPRPPPACNRNRQTIWTGPSIPGTPFRAAAATEVLLHRRIATVLPCDHWPPAAKANSLNFQRFTSYHERVSHPPRRTISLLLAPRLMLERGLQFHRAPSAQARRR